MNNQNHDNKTEHTNMHTTQNFIGAQKIQVDTWKAPVIIVGRRILFCQKVYYEQNMKKIEMLDATYTMY
jgi:hypothetical protein